MVRIDCFIFGYREISYSEATATALAGLFLRRGISVRLSEGRAILRERDFSSLKAELEKIDVVVSEPRGIPEIISNIKKRKGAIAAVILLVLAFFVTSELVWAVRVEGNENLTKSEVEEALREAGLSVGSVWRKTDLSSVESHLLESSESIVWISIIKSGTVACVKILEGEGKRVEQADKSYSNIVAVCDAVIEEITVTSGYPVVKVGDAVKAGDLLISGVLPESVGGGFCYADGTVKARVYEELTVSAPKNETKSRPAVRELSEISLQIFNFSINIFKKYGKAEIGCDIIEDIEDCVVLGRYKLPFAITKTYAVKKDITERTYTESEMIKIASSRHAVSLRQRLLGGDLIAIKTSGGFDGETYRMTSYFTVTREIGKNVSFSVTDIEK